jgi:poly-beta-1,6-N-acetyl-D-glucosamine synthase
MALAADSAVQASSGPAQPSSRMAPAHRILIISPVRNEAQHVERVGRALAAQELPPARWIVVDDRSTDGTWGVLERLREDVPFLELRRAPDDVAHDGARDRLARAAAPRNFNLGLAGVDWEQYTHIMKLDGDIELPPDYLRRLMERFDAEPDIGLAGGVLIEPQPEGGYRAVTIPRYHVHGALKCYSRACFAAIGGVQERLAWDTIDETYARMRGFRTVSFSDLVSIHHRPCGSADGVLRGRARHGECAYISYYPPTFAVLRAFKVGLTKPRGASGVAFLFGYVRAAVRRVPRVADPDYRRFTRRELWRRMIRVDLSGRLSAG